MRALVLIWAAIVAVYWFDVSYNSGIHVEAMEAVGRHFATAIVAVMAK